MSNQNDLSSTHGRIGFSECEMLMCFLLRDPQVFSRARPVLQVAHFTGDYEVIWALCWQACSDMYNQFGALPPHHFLLSEIRSRISDHPGQLPYNALAEVEKFLSFVFSAQQSTFDSWREYGFSLLQKFLIERHWSDPLKRYVQDFGDANPADIQGLLTEFRNRHDTVQGIRSSVSSPLVPDGGWQEDNFTIIPTGFPFLDLAMGGGGVDGEVYGILGGFGSGKTMMACGICAEAANRSVVSSIMHNTVPRDVFYFTYETPPNDIRKRVLSYLSGVPLDQFNSLPYVTTFSREGARKPYESEMFPTDPRGEWERLNDTRAIWQTFQLMDMRGSPPNSAAGSGGVEEIRAELERHRAMTGRCPDTVVIDYASICVRRQMAASNMDISRHGRYALMTFGDDVRRLIAEPMRCRVWVLSQLSGQANKKTSGSLITHADAGESSNFAENMWYAFVLGNKDHSTGAVVFNCSKARRSAGHAPMILQLDGRFSRFTMADDRFMLDPNTRRIVSRVAGGVVAPEQARARSSAPRGQAGDSMV